MSTVPEFHGPGKFCADCGNCCRHYPGGHLPSDFGLDIPAGVRAALESGRYALDWWEGDVDGHDNLSCVYYLRPSTKGKEGHIFDPSWGGECTFLTASGCSLSREKMPAECKALRPRTTADGDCPSTLIKEDVCREWRPYQSLLAMIGNAVSAPQEAA